MSWLDDIADWIRLVSSGGSQITRPNLDPKVIIDLNQKKKNPPLPPGFRLMRQSDVTGPIVTWATKVRDDKLNPMFTMATRVFGDKTIMARIEWHTYQGKTGKKGIFRGMTLYELVPQASVGVEEIVSRWQRR